MVYSQLGSLELSRIREFENENFERHLGVLFVPFLAAMEVIYGSWLTVSKNYR